MKVLFFVFLFLVVDASWAGLRGEDSYFRMEGALNEDFLLDLGVKRIYNTMYIADDWREFHVHWNWNAWPEDVLDKLSNHVQIDGFAPITWAKRRNDKKEVLDTNNKFIGPYDTFYFTCVNETAFRGLKLYE